MTQQIALHSYNIFVSEIWEALELFLKENKYTRLIAITDNNTKRYCFPQMQQALPDFTFEQITIPPGEKHKTLETCQDIWKALFELKVDRKALVLNLGGGVIGDMGGFCASTYKRGIDFVQLPTTLLSQVDASIGGKLGIDFMQVKNSIGLFCNPKAVFVEPNFLNTLSEKELRSGFAEVIKHSLIADAQQWKDIQQFEKLDTVDWPSLLVASLLIKKNIVESDPFEKGLRKALNFGHTVGHAVEGHALESAQPLLHGEAIAIGMICESYLSYVTLGLPKEDLAAITAFLKAIYQPKPVYKANYGTYLDLMANDKKNEGATINFSLIEKPGIVMVNQTCTPELIKESLDYFNASL